MFRLNCVLEMESIQFTLSTDIRRIPEHRAIPPHEITSDIVDPVRGFLSGSCPFGDQVIIDECLKGWKELEYEVM